MDPNLHALAEALGSDVGHGHDDDLHSTVMAARNAVLNQLRRGKTKAPRAWIISANPAAESIFPFHERVVVDPGLDVVLEQARAAGRPERWQQLIRDWYAAREGRTTAKAGASRRW